MTSTKKTKYLLFDCGSVEVDGIYGSDEDIIRRTIASSSSRIDRELTDRQIIRYLLEHHHSSPLRFPQITLRIVAPIFVKLQWTVNRSGIRLSHEDIENIASDEIEGGECVEKEYNPFYDTFLDTYFVNIPLSTFTSWYWQQSLWDTLDWLRVRRNDNNKLELRAYADVVEDIIKNNFPLTYDSYLQFVEGSSLLKEDVEELLPLLEGKAVSNKLAIKLGIKND